MEGVDLGRPVPPPSEEDGFALGANWVRIVVPTGILSLWKTQICPVFQIWANRSRRVTCLLHFVARRE